LKTSGFDEGVAKSDAELEVLGSKFETTAVKATIAAEAINSIPNRMASMSVTTKMAGQNLGEFERWLDPLTEKTILFGWAQEFAKDRSVSWIGILSPLILGVGLLAGALVAVTAVLVVFTAAAIGFVIWMAIAAGAIALLGAGIAALGIISSGGMTAQQDLTKAQQNVAAATKTHEAAVLALQRAELAGGPTHTFTASQLLTLHQAQQNVATTEKALTTAQTQLTEAQQKANGPLPVLIQHVKDLGEALGKQAMPMAMQMVTAVDTYLVPAFGKLAGGAIQWFAAWFPAIMKTSADAAGALGAGVGRLGVVFEQMLDRWMSNLPKTGPIMNTLFQGMIDMIIGLLTNLEKLGYWFVDNLPRYGPVVGQIFSAIGSTIQMLIALLVQLSDWTITNWPNIVSALNIAGGALTLVAHAIQFVLDHLNVFVPIAAVVLGIWAAWNLVILAANIITGVHTGLQAALTVAKIAGATATWIATAAQWAWNIAMVANPIGLVIIGIAALIGIIILVVTHWNFVVSVLGLVWRWLSQVGLGFLSSIPIIGSLVVAVVWLVTHWNSVIGVVQAVIGWFGHAGDVFSWLGSRASDLANAIGSAFSWIGTKIHDGLWQARSVIGGFLDMARNIPIIGGLLRAAGFPGSSDLPRFGSGGVVPGQLGAGDVIPALLTPGEVVLNRSAVGALGGAQTANQLNQLGAGSVTPGDWGGQCVVFVEQVTGHYFPVDMASQMAAYVNSSTPSPGSIFVSTLPPYGHTGFVLSGGRVLDSNWGLDERIRIHNLSDIPSIAGYISGLSIPNVPGGFDVGGALRTLASHINTGGGWEGSVAGGYVQAIADRAANYLHLDMGGVLPPGLSLAYNGTGSPEALIPAGRGGYTTANIVLQVSGRTFARLIGVELRDELHLKGVRTS